MQTSVGRGNHELQMAMIAFFSGHFGRVNWFTILGARPVVNIEDNIGVLLWF